MSDLHRLLNRQLKRHFGAQFSVPDEWRGVLADISDAYHDFDIGRELRERSLVLSSQELQGVNEQLKSEMAKLAQTEEFLRQSQKMEAVGQLAGGIAHDFNNLLTIIRGYVQCLQELPNTSLPEALREIDVAAERAAKLTAQMLMFSRKKQLHLKPVNLNALIVQLGTMLHRLVGESITVEIQTGGKPLMVHADPVMVEMILLNLAVNARDAMTQGGRLTVEIDELEIRPGDRRADAAVLPGKFACIRVADTGCGIAPEVLPHLFEPFFTTKEVGKGTGLGLASVYGVVKQHAGWIEVESEPGHGAVFKVFLPVSVPSVAPATPTVPKSTAGTGPETILLVEDEEVLRRLTRTVLQRRGYRVYEAGSGEEAMTVWDEHGPEIHLLLTDMIMPGKLSVREMSGQLQQKKSSLKIIYTSGYNPETVSQDLVLNEGVNFLPKPYPPDKLLQIIRRCLDET